jgi:hypothetical protein
VLFGRGGPAEHRDRRSTLGTAGAVAIYVVPIVLLAWLRLDTDERLAAIEPTKTPLEATATLTEFRDRQAVTVIVRYSDADTVLAPNWTGIVTGLPAGPGTELKPGQVVAQIEGINRIAYVAPRPLFRPLTVGATAADSAELEDVLIGLGYMAAGKVRPYDGVVATAVHRLTVAVGAPGDGSTFDPSWLVWLPRDPFPITKVNALVSAPAPAAGTPVLTAPPRIRELTVTTRTGPPDLEGNWVLDLHGTAIQLTDGRPSPDGLVTLAAASDPANDEPATGQITRAEPRKAIAVAASAVIAGPHDTFCVMVPGRPTGHYRSQAVSIGEGTTSGVELTSGLDDHDTYLANPGELEEVPACP